MRKMSQNRSKFIAKYLKKSNFTEIKREIEDKLKERCP